MQGYNAQAVVTPQQFILAAQVTTDANDVQQLKRMLDLTQAVVEMVMGEDAVLGAAAADAGYWSEDNAASQTLQCKLFIATKQDRQQRTRRGRAIYRQRGASVEPVFGQMRSPGCRPLQLARSRRMPRRTAPPGRHPQLAQAAPAVCPLRQISHTAAPQRPQD
jgi:hypothetical protein